MLTLEEAREEADKIKNPGFIPDHPRVRGEQCVYLKVNGACYRCCDSCNYVSHKCYGCGADLDHNGYEHVSPYMKGYVSPGRKRLHNTPEDNCYDG